MTPQSSAHRRRSDGDEQASIALAGLAPILVAALLVPVRGVVGVADLALVLMAVVVLGALAGGRAAGAVAALTATLSLDFFLTRPYLTLRMTSRDDIETAAILLVAGMAVGQFAARFRAARQAAERGRSGLAGVHRLAGLAVSGADAGAVIEAGRRELAALIDLRECRFERLSAADESGTEPLPATALARLGRDGTIERPPAPISVIRHGREGEEIPADGLAIAVLSAGVPVGRFVLVPQPGEGLDPERGRAAVALADQVGLALAAGAPAATTGSR